MSASAIPTAADPDALTFDARQTAALRRIFDAQAAMDDAYERGDFFEICQAEAEFWAYADEFRRLTPGLPWEG